MNSSSNTPPPFLAHVREFDKERQLLADHLLQVSEIAEQFVAPLGLGDAGALIGLMHDMDFVERKGSSKNASSMPLVQVKIRPI